MHSPGRQSRDGNGEVPGAEIIGSQECVDALAAAAPSRNTTFMRAANVIQTLGGAGRMAGRICTRLDQDSVSWLDAERVFVNVHTLYLDFAGNPDLTEILK